MPFPPGTLVGNLQLIVHLLDAHFPELDAQGTMQSKATLASFHATKVTSHAALWEQTARL